MNEKIIKILVLLITVQNIDFKNWDIFSIILFGLLIIYLGLLSKDFIKSRKG